MKEKSHLSESTYDDETKGVKTLLGNPKKAIIKLATPMIIAMSVTTLYNLVDAIWVSGLGPDALAAVGFVFPFMFMAMALANGLGIGGGSSISRKIGAKDKKGADSVAVHTLILMLIIAIFFTLPIFFFADEIFSLIGAGQTTPLAAEYARIISTGATVIFFSFIANAILRAEGDAKRAMFAMALGGILNIVLDPIFIYSFGLGVAGAAFATVLSMSVSSILLFYWLFLKKNTYLTFVFRKFQFRKEIIKDIFKVTIPASFQQLSMSVMMLMMTILVVGVGGTDGVAVFSAGWRIATIAIMPLLGIATAVVTVTGATYGAKEYKKLNAAYMYALKLGTIVEIGIAVATFVLAPVITLAFTQSKDASRIADDLTTFLRIICVFYPGVAFGMLSSSTFQGVGKGVNALVVSILRTIILIVPLAWILSSILGLPGAWWGLVAGALIGSFVAFLWAKLYIRKLIRSPKPVEQ